MWVDGIGGVMKAKVSLLARINDGTRAFPFVTVNVARRGIKLPVEKGGKTYLQDSILGFYVRYTDNGKRRIEKIGKDDLVDVLARYQAIERDHSRIREGKLPLEQTSSLVQKPGSRSLVTCSREFEEYLVSIKRKPRAIESYMGSIRCFMKSCNKQIDDITRKDILNFLDWMESNLQKRSSGHPNNTYRNKLRDVKIFLKHFGVEMPLETKSWPKEIEKKKEKYSTESVNKMMKAAKTEDEKDLLNFLLKTGFRDDEVAHAQYKDIDFKKATINVHYKPEFNWTPKDNEPRKEDIVLESRLVDRMKARMRRYNSKPADLIFPNSAGKPNQHLVRIVQQVAKRAKIEGTIGLHKFRKTFGTLVAKQMGLEQARIWLGHDDVQTTQSYLASDEMTPEQSRKAVTSLFSGFGD
jgi:integrase/recombinase XerD